MTPGDEEKPQETNFYKQTLASAKTTAVNARNAVFDTPTTIVDPIANPLAQGGWVCSAADDWIAELTSKLSGTDTAFDTAISQIEAAHADELDYVDAGDPHGNAWPSIWGLRHNLM